MLKQYTNLLYRNQKGNEISYFIFFNILSIFFETFSIALIPIFIAYIIKPEIVSLIPIDQVRIYIENLEYITSIYLGVLVFVIIFILRNMFNYFLIKYRLKLQANFNYQIKKMFFSLYLFSPFELLNNYNLSEILNNVEQQTTDYVSNFFLMIKFGKDILLFSLIFFLLLYADYLSTLIVMAILLIVLLLYIRFFRKKMQLMGEQSLRTKGLLFKWINQSLGMIKEIKVSRKENLVIEKFLGNVSLFEEAKMKLNLIQVLPSIFFEIIFVLLILTVVVIVVSVDIISMLPVLSLYVVASVRLLPIVSKFGSYITSLKSSYPSVSLLNSEMKKLEESSNKNQKEELENIQNDISLNDKISLKELGFQYKKINKRILDEINLEINKTDMVVFVGKTGSGKSTIINLISGLLVPTKGVILADGKNINTNLSKWQKKIGLLTQHNYLLDDTIKNNIVFLHGENDLNNERLDQCIKLSGLDELIKELPNGLDTIVGDKGNFLSSGQIQRIALARVLYKDPEILILDEFTSALDQDTEKSILQNIKNYQSEKNKTVIIISHKLGPLKHCNKIVLLKEGKIIDQVNYEDYKKKYLIIDEI
ncbi:ABC transporter ATP-binding protein/permease [Candidatus Pelagibacter sp.]|jgi:ATP-binding cassette, subfamily B, bacterial PglK|nr:ABC transporter ATP-binding protein/permease [Candidatus Pelagibacter sp.]